MEFREKNLLECMEFLLREAQGQAPVRNARIAAGLIYKGELVTVGYNKLKSHPFQKRFSKNDDAIFLHAENDCLVNAINEIPDILTYLDKCALLVARSKRGPSGWVAGIAKPCSGCQRAAAHFGISKVYYTNDEGGIECL